MAMMSKPGWIRGLFAVALFLLAGSVAQARPPPPQYWQADIDALVAGDSAHPPPQHGVLFVGSSSIRMWTTLAADFPGVPVIDRGFGGSVIADTTHFANRIVIPCHPRLIVMYAGDNDIAEGETPQRVLVEFKAFVARVRRGLPDVAIAYISIKPSIARFAMWPRMREANRLIADWMQTQTRMSFVDVSAGMLDKSGKPRAALFRADGLHMTAAGYAVWVQALKPVLARYGFKVH